MDPKLWKNFVKLDIVNIILFKDNLAIITRDYGFETYMCSLNYKTLARNIKYKAILHTQYFYNTFTINH